MPDFSFEDQCCGETVCGIDEVGRGPLAGPVVAAAVVIDRDTMPLDILVQINDSKKLTARKRAFLFDQIRLFSDVGIGTCSVEEIDDMNILQASLTAMSRAFAALRAPPKHALIDGNKAPKLACSTKTIVGGDGKSFSIAAASIIAKHHRDSYMQKIANDFPNYGWEKNAGYGTAYHLQALEIYGVTIHHRQSFSPVSNIKLKESSAKN